MQAIEERMCDRAVLSLLRGMLRAGVMEGGSVRRSAAGTPQGGVISPVLCNVYLHRLDRAWSAAEHGVLVRYADLCRARHKSAYAEHRIMPTRLPMPWSEEGWPFSGRHNPAVPAVICLSGLCQ